MLLRKLGKKDTTTKTKALHELREAISSHGADWSELLLPQWCMAYARLAEDASWQVRASSCELVGLLASQLKKRFAPHLKQLFVPWLRCRFDPQHDVRTAALNAFGAAFPGEGNYRRALSLFVEDVVRGLVELVHAKAPGKTGDEAADAEAAEGHARKVTTSLQAAAHLLTEAAAAAAAAAATATAAAATAATPAAPPPASATGLASKVGRLLTEQMLLGPLWKLASSSAVPIRTALYKFVHVLLTASPELAAACAEPLATTLLDALRESEPAAHAALWEPLLLFVHHHPSAVAASSAGKHVLPRLVNLLEHGCHGAAPTVAAALMPLTSQLSVDLTTPAAPPAHLAPAAKLLTALSKGLRTNATIPAAHFRPLLKAHGELLLLLVARLGGDAAVVLPPNAMPASQLFDLGLGTPLRALLEGALPPRLSDLVATESLCAAVVDLAASSRCTHYLESYLPALLYHCKQACAMNAPAGAAERAAAFLTTLRRQLHSAARPPSARKAADAKAAVAAGYCAGVEAAFTRLVASFWCALVVEAAAAPHRPPPAPEVILAMSREFGACALWAAAHAPPPSTGAVPVCCMQPSGAATVSLTMMFVPAGAAELASVPDLMQRWLLPWARAVMGGGDGEDESDSDSDEDTGANARRSHARLVWPLIASIQKEVGAYSTMPPAQRSLLAAGADDAPAAASMLLRTSFAQLLSTRSAQPADVIELLVSAHAAGLTPAFWRSPQLDGHIMRAAKAALGPLADDEVVDGTSLRLVLHASSNAELLSDAALASVVDFAASTVSSCVGRRVLTASVLARLAAALQLARVLSTSFAGANGAGREASSDAVARAVVALLTALYATLVTWPPAGGWLRTAALSASMPGATPAAAPSHDLLAESGVTVDDEAALVAVSTDIELAEVEAEVAMAEEEAAGDEAAAGTTTGGDDGAQAAADCCESAVHVWSALAPKAAHLLKEHAEVHDGMLDGMRRLASSAVPSAVGYASGWRDGARRWAWAVTQLTVALHADKDIDACDAVGEEAWASALSAAPQGAPGVGSWRLCALALSLLDAPDLEVSAPPTGERGKLGLGNELLAWLLVLHHSAHASAARDGSAHASSSSVALHLELHAFVCVRLLPYLRSVLPARPPLLGSLLRTTLRIAATDGADGPTPSAATRAAAARAAATVLRCALDTCGPLESRRVAADVILTPLGPSPLPASLSAMQALQPPVLPLLAHVVSASVPMSAYVPVDTHVEDAASGGMLTSLAADALKLVMSLRPTASAAARAALARFGGGVGGGDDEATQLGGFARSTRVLSELLPLSHASMTSTDCDALIEQLMKMDDARRSPTAPVVASTAAGAALCELLGALVVASGARAGVVAAELVFTHGQWTLPLIEEAIKGCAAASSSTPPSTVGTGAAAGSAAEEEPVVRAAIITLLAMRAQVGAPSAAAPPVDDLAAAATAAIAPRLERLLQLVTTWLLSHGVTRATRRGSQRTLCMALQAALLVPPSSLPTGTAVAPIGGLACAPHPAVRARALALIGRLPADNASIPPRATSAGPANAGRGAEVVGADEEEALSDAQLEGIFSPALLAAMADGTSSAAVRFGAWGAALELHARLEPAAQRVLANHWMRELLQESSSVSGVLQALLESLPLTALTPAPPPPPPPSPPPPPPPPPPPSRPSARLRGATVLRRPPWSGLRPRGGAATTARRPCVRSATAASRPCAPRTRAPWMSHLGTPHRRRTPPARPSSPCASTCSSSVSCRPLCATGGRMRSTSSAARARSSSALRKCTTRPS